jgi:hypothetical protein
MIGTETLTSSRPRYVVYVGEDEISLCVGNAQDAKARAAAISKNYSVVAILVENGRAIARFLQGYLFLGRLPDGRPLLTTAEAWNPDCAN